MKMKPIKYSCLFVFFFTVNLLSAQDQYAELNRLIDLAINNNKELKSYDLQTQSSKANIGTAFDFNKTSVYYSFDENNMAPNDKALRVFGVEQSFLFPTVYGAQRNVYKSEWKQSKAMYDIRKNKLVYDVSSIYEQIVFVQNKQKMYAHLDSLYAEFSRAGRRRFELGESNYLEKITAEAKSKQVHTTLMQLGNQKKGLYEELKALLQTDDSVAIHKNELDLLVLNGVEIGQELQNNYMQSVSDTYASKLKLQSQNWLPDLSVELFTGTTRGLGYHQNGFKIGVAIPLFFNGNIAKRKTAKLEQQSWEMMRDNRKTQMERFYMQKRSELNQHQEMIKYYEENGRMLSQEIMKTAVMSFQNGEIDFFQYIQSIENSVSIEIEYLDNVLLYNKSYLDLYYFNFNE